MIEVRHLVKHYGPKVAVNDISFKINEGEVVGFLGPNGAGKTTTMNIVTGYISATSGDALVNGIDILDNPLEAKKHIGYLPEHPPLYFDMTVKEYLNFVYELKGAAQPKKEHIDGICELVGITEVYNRMTKNLSKGYKQRVGLAQSLIGDPDVLILDEPTVGLDPKQIIDIRNLIKDLGKKRTIILSSHILPEVQAICERVLVISNGKLVGDNTPEKLTANKTSSKQSMIIRVAGDQKEVTAILKKCDGVSLVEPQGIREEGSFDYYVEASANIDIRKLLFNALAKTGNPILMMQPAGISLEEAFIRLTSEDEEEKKHGEDEK